MKKILFALVLFASVISCQAMEFGNVDIMQNEAPELSCDKILVNDGAVKNSQTNISMSPTRSFENMFLDTRNYKVIQMSEGSQNNYFDGSVDPEDSDGYFVVNLCSLLLSYNQGDKTFCTISYVAPKSEYEPKDEASSPLRWLFYKHRDLFAQCISESSDTGVAILCAQRVLYANAIRYYENFWASALGSKTYFYKREDFEFLTKFLDHLKKEAKQAYNERVVQHTHNTSKE